MRCYSVRIRIAEILQGEQSCCSSHSVMWDLPVNTAPLKLKGEHKTHLSSPKTGVVSLWMLVHMQPVKTLPDLFPKDQPSSKARQGQLHKHGSRRTWG